MKLNSKAKLPRYWVTISEEIVFGSITTGASNDLQRATDLAERMARLTA